MGSGTEVIWVTWRQHRAEAAVGALILATLSAGLVILGTIARDRARALGVSACTSAAGRCGSAIDRLHQDFHSIPPFTAALIAVPLLAGMFWAAPLVSREYEAGTHRLAWTQSVSPLRWITAKIALIFGASAVAALGLGLLATWTLDPLTPAFGGRYNSSWYDIQGIVPVACILFALGVGLTASALLKRTVPAIALTLVVYAAARIPIHFIRAHFAPITTRVISLQQSGLTKVPGATVTQRVGGSPLKIFIPNLPLGDWLLSVSRIDSRHEVIHYQIAAHFWLIQTAESAIFLILTALLVFTAIRAITRRSLT
ncbi:MAG: hypothetical protein M3P18_25215 [Actinomycetota bacterium]|nr:hypothetical protein [Actinomycetota bacterium]